MDVVEELPEAKANLLVLAGAAQAFDLGDVDTSTPSPSSVKLWPPRHGSLTSIFLRPR
jgi:hypothetical protein